jgi:hypothetical protein
MSAPDSSAVTTQPPTTAVIELAIGGSDLLTQMAQSAGVSARCYLEALLHYAGSCYNRDGSWEACRQFDFATYDTRTDDGHFADRWFTSDESANSQAQRKFDAHCAVLKEDVDYIEKEIADLEQRCEPNDREYITWLRADLEDARAELASARIGDFQ